MRKNLYSDNAAGKHRRPNLVFSTFIGLAIGYGLDSLFHTSPWLTIIFLVIGIMAGFRELLRIAKKQDNGSDTKNT
jgi:ATP synthase protein I